MTIGGKSRDAHFDAVWAKKNNNFDAVSDLVVVVHCELRYLTIFSEFNLKIEKTGKSQFD